MTDDIEERAVLARRGIMDHSDCEDCVEDWTFLMRQGRREFPLGLRTAGTPRSRTAPCRRHDATGPRRRCTPCMTLG